MSKKIKIAYIISTLESCGPVNVLYNIIKYIDKTKYEPYIITLSQEPKNSRIQDFENENCSIYQLNLSRFEGIFKARRKIQTIIDRYNIDIIHSHGFRSDSLAGKLRGIKTISTIHNYPRYDYIMTYGSVKGIVMSEIHIKCMKKLDLPCACSESVFDNLKKLIGANLDVVQNGIDTQIFTYGDNKSELRTKLGLPKDKVIFIVVGSIISRKDNKTILECFKQRNINNEIVLFLGDGEQYDEFKDNYSKYDNIKFVGRVNNVDEYMKASNYYISASLAEGLPNTVMEALASGLPCILSDIPPHLEIIKYNFNTAKVFTCKNVKELSLVIDDIDYDGYEKISYSCRELIENNLSAKIMAKSYENKYKKVLE